MLTLLYRLVRGRRSSMSSADERGLWGSLCGAVGIGLNLLLFAVKLFAGTVAGSIAVTADAFNNLSDAASSVITIIGFRLAGQKPDPTHPFGHGRMEHVTGLIISALILLTGYELLTSSIGAIAASPEVGFGLLPAGILLLSVLVKGYMFAYNRAVGKRIQSATVLACASDSLYDMLATAIVLLGMLCHRFFGWHIDGWCGLLVSLFILKGGICSGRDTVNELLGHAPDPALVREIEAIVLSHQEISGIHDLIVHDYGAGRLMVSLHAEVSAEGDLLLLHDAIDNVERQIRDKIGCFATIHMDPVQTADETVSALYHQVKDMVQTFDPTLSMHDFRMVPGATHTNLIFDVVVPYGYSMPDQEVVAALSSRIRAMGEYYAVIEIDKSYTG